MTHRKRTPYLFLGFLLLVLLFIMGVRYGQQVEKTNKLTSFLVSIAPSTTTAPSTVPLAFKTYKHTTCGVQFLLPTSFTTVKEGTEGAMLQDAGTIKVSFECRKQSAVAQVAPSTQTLTFQKKLIPVKESGSFYIFTLRNPNNNLSVELSVEKAFYPLLEKSLEFM
ncbi:hypothetical protein HZC27_03495 [Candidatus Roizmanbacteria bacterium]|nr:hypothetical protein [Candidatus Roizmanbacteria bacterium]